MGENELRLCKDCKHVKRGFGYFLIEQPCYCAHPSQLSKSDGEADQFCDLVREYYGACGKIARLFEPKGPKNYSKVKWIGVALVAVAVLSWVWC